MTDTTALIARLSSEAQTIKPMRSPVYWSVRLVAVLILYGLGAQLFLGIRPDLALQVTRLFFTAEIALLAALLLTGVVASVLAMYPDAYQKPGLLALPYAIFLLLAGLILYQLPGLPDARMVMPKPGAHGMECALCIASVALIPSALIFAVLRSGATVRQLQAGSLAVLTASAAGCLTLRLAESNDSLQHLAGWHYLPTVLFAAFGAYLGKWLLKW